MKIYGLSILQDWFFTTICDPIQQKVHLVYLGENWYFCFIWRFKKLSNDTKFIKIEGIVLHVLQSVNFLLFNLYFTHCFAHYLRCPFCCTGSHFKSAFNDILQLTFWDLEVTVSYYIHNHLRQLFTVCWNILHNSNLDVMIKMTNFMKISFKLSLKTIQTFSTLNVISYLFRKLLWFMVNPNQINLFHVCCL